MRREALQDLYEEHRRPIHQHEVSWASHSGAEGLSPGIDSASTHWCTCGQTGRVSGCGGDLPDNLSRPRQPRQGKTRHDIFTPGSIPVVGINVVERVALAGGW